MVKISIGVLVTKKNTPWRNSPAGKTFRRGRGEDFRETSLMVEFHHDLKNHPNSIKRSLSSSWKYGKECFSRGIISKNFFFWGGEFAARMELPRGKFTRGKYFRGKKLYGGVVGRGEKIVSGGGMDFLGVFKKRPELNEKTSFSLLKVRSSINT